MVGNRFSWLRDYLLRGVVGSVNWYDGVGSKKRKLMQRETTKLLRLPQD